MYYDDSKIEQLLNEVIEEMERQEARMERKARTMRKICEAKERKAEHRNKRETKEWAMSQWEV